MAEKKRQGERKKVANKIEVAAYFTGVMRGELAADEKMPGVKDQLKAAELLGKHFGMFEQKEAKEGIEMVEFTGDEKLED